MRILFSISLVFTLCTGLFAQCSFNGLSLSEQMLVPDTIIQLQVGDSFTFTREFQNFDTIQGIAVEWLIIDSATNLPPGLSFSSLEMSGNDTIEPNEFACYTISGICTAGHPESEALIWITAKNSLLPNPISGNTGFESLDINSPPTNKFSFYVPWPLNITAYKTINLSIYPNPTNGLTNLTWANEVRQASFQLMDITGREVFTKEEVSGKELQFDVSTLPQGVYYYQLSQQGERLSSGKFMVK